MDTFRVWDVRNQGYLHDCAIDQHGQLCISLEHKAWIWDRKFQHENFIIEPEFGLRDTHGIPIFAGDIILQEGVIYAAFVLRSNCGISFSLQELEEYNANKGGGTTCSLNLYKHPEIVGNIHKQDQLFAFMNNRARD